MKFLIIGLGSMGKRRIRNLQALAIQSIEGFDLREDRRIEAAQKYGITTHASFQDSIQQGKYDAFIISVPPDLHHIYMKEAVRLNVPFFVEASVVDDDMELILEKVRTQKLLAAPSSTMFFHPAIKKINSIVRENGIGEITNIQYHSGQYLPDWHTYEKVSEFYVSNKATGGAREIVPFELTWLVSLLGFPKQVSGFYKKTIYIEGAETIDDTYSGMYDYGKFVLNLTVDVVSRIATRRLFINGSAGQLQWDWNDSFVSVHSPTSGLVKHEFEVMQAEVGYNKNITEQMYIDEMACFISALKNEKTFVNNLANDHRVLKLLYALEKSQETGKTILI